MAIALVTLPAWIAFIYWLVRCSGRSKRTDSDAVASEGGIYAFAGTAGVVVLVFCVIGAFHQTSTSLKASGDTIEVRGCARARPFLATFDKREMSAIYRLEQSRYGSFPRLILKQKGQRTVKFDLGKEGDDEKLTLIAPEAMKEYAAHRTRD